MKEPGAGPPLNFHNGGCPTLRVLQRWIPLKRGLVLEPAQWGWSSFRNYADGERGPVLVNETRKAELRVREIL